MKDFLFKKVLLVVLGGFCLGFILSCKNDNTSVTNTPQSPSPQQEGATAIGFVYGNHFRVQNSSVYETLLEACRRCGTRRLIRTPGGQTIYQRFRVPDSDPKRCKNWNSNGYVQIEFAQKALPTEATVSIWPKYTGYDRSVPEWGEPFAVKATANAINENKGFQILVNPVDGLGGVYSLIVKSDHSNHVLQDQLDVQITYGQQEKQTIALQGLPKLANKTIKEAPFTCATYTN